MAVSVENMLSILRKTALFAGVDDTGLLQLIACLQPVQRSYGKGEAILRAGEPNRRVGVVLTGRIEAYRDVPDGARAAIARMGEGGVFGDVLGGSSLASPVTVVAAEPCLVLLWPYERILLPCGQSCTAHATVLRNLVRTVSDKYFSLARRLDLLTMKSLRGRICAWLLAEAEQAGADTFTVPMTRVQLAEYLNCDRSALSRELSRMQAEGLIETYRNSFKLLRAVTLRQLCDKE